MRPPRLRAALPWLIGVSLLASLACLALALAIGIAAQTDADQQAARRLTNQADVLARQIDADVALFGLALREVARTAPARDGTTPPPTLPLLDLPLTAQYIGFTNVLNEAGDVVADPRSNVSRPANFVGRDYFQDHLKNPADVVMIGRPFGTAPNQHPSIPISRRLDRPDGGFAGVVVAGVRLTWLSDLLSLPWPGPRPTITVRRDDGLILMRNPYDPDAIGRAGALDPAWRDYLRTGLSLAAGGPRGVHLFRRLGTSPLVLELALDPAEIAAETPSWLPLLPLVPGLCTLGLGVAALRLRRLAGQLERGIQVAADDGSRRMANMNHELRTPLTGILGQAELMLGEGGLNEHQTERLSQIAKAGELMRGIVNRVLDVAHPDDAGGPPALTPTDLDPLIRACIGVVEPAAMRKGLHLSSTVDPATPRRIMLASDQVRQVLNNLLMNAVKYTAQGTVELRIGGDTARLRIEVADTGPGIPANKRHRLFRAYDRLDNPDAEGTGLGLTISERLVRAMGGAIGQRDNPGGGSVFWVDLPTRLPPPAAAPDASPAAAAAEVRHLRVLVADDQESNRMVIRGFLGAAGHVVTEVADGEFAIAELGARDIDVLLTDMRMPDVDGLELTRRVRALPGPLGHTPVVLVTADLRALRACESGQAGVDGWVRKPFTRDELLAAVATAGRLSFPPAAPVPRDTVLDESALAEIREALSGAAFATLLDDAARRIQGLLPLLAGQSLELTG